MSRVVRVFGGARMAVGALSWMAPSLSARVFGVDERTDPIVTELFGVRDFALGLLTATSAGAARRQVLRAGVAIDLADTVASLRQIRAGVMSTRAKLLVAGGAGLFATIGLAALATDDSSPDTVG